MNANLNTGEIASPDAIIGNKFYYNGSDNLSAIHVECTAFNTNPTSCVGNSACGWCGASNTCVSGTPAGPSNNGPIGACLRNTFLFTAPSDNWNPLQASTINLIVQDKKENTLIQKTNTPDLTKMDVWNPYK